MIEVALTITAGRHFSLPAGVWCTGRLAAFVLI
jgi:hypothetical protein